MSRGLLVIAALAAGAPARPMAPPPARPLAHDTYLWQQVWTAPVQASVAAAPAELDGLRVLMLEVRPRISTTFPRTEPWWVPVDPASLARAHRPVTAVIRIEGARLPPADEPVPMTSVIDRIEAWRAAGVDVVGVEIDHDSATAALADYATWLRAMRPRAPLRWSITALPTWADDPAGLRALAAAVDELVVQVHAVRYPRIFDDAEARGWIRAVAAAAPHARLRVALPTYRTPLAAASPVEVARFLRWLERGPDAPAVRGVVWFRLPVDGDRNAWPTPTLRAVIRGDRLAPAVSVSVVARAPGLHDLVLTNRGTLAAPWPALRLRGADTADLIGGYAPDPDAAGRWAPPARELQPGQSTIVGWAAGEEVAVDAR